MTAGLFVPFECSMPRDPKMRAAGPLARLIYFEATLHCRENLTDGLIHRPNLLDFAVDVPTKRKLQLLDKLHNVGALESVTKCSCKQGPCWRIPEHVWRRRNPLRSEVEAKRQAEADRKAAYRKRNRGDSPELPLADRDVLSQRDTTSRYVAVSQRDARSRANSHSHSHSHSENPHTQHGSLAPPTTGEASGLNGERTIAATVASLADRWRT